MTAPEAPLEDHGAGLAPTARGWFVVNLADAKARRGERIGIWTDVEPPEGFEDFGVGVHVLQPGQPNGMYHEEDNQEDFLVLLGECIVLVEERLRRLNAWDFVHCPRGTRHIFVGAGDGPCAILMVGTRRPGVLYPVSELAARHGASVTEAVTTSREAYAGDPPHTDARFRWPPES